MSQQPNQLRSAGMAPPRRGPPRCLSPSNAIAWLDRIDPGMHRRIKGLRLVTAFGIASMLGTMGDITHGLPGGASLNVLAGGFGLWASVSDGRATRAGSSRDLLLLSLAAVLGAMSFILLAPPLGLMGRVAPELVLASGAFFVGYLRRFGLTGTGFGSQIYIGQLLAYSIHLTTADVSTVVMAGLIAALASIVPRVLSGPAEHPPPAPAPMSRRPGSLRPELVMGLQAASAGVIIVGLNAAIGLLESVWAITACTYVVAGSASATIDRARRRVPAPAIGCVA